MRAKAASGNLPIEAKLPPFARIMKAGHWAFGTTLARAPILCSGAMPTMNIFRLRVRIIPDLKVSGPCCVKPYLIISN